MYFKAHVKKKSTAMTPGGDFLLINHNKIEHFINVNYSTIMTFNGEEQIGIGGGKLPSSSPSKKFGGMLHPPPPKFKELREFLLLEGRGTKPWSIVI